jgi:hypothetical protein
MNLAGRPHMQISWFVGVGLFALVGSVIVYSRLCVAKSDLGPVSPAWVAEHRDMRGNDPWN